MNLIIRILRNTPTAFSLFLGGIAFSFGVWVALPDESFNTPTFEALIQASGHREWVAGTVYVLIGLAVMASPWLPHHPRWLSRLLGMVAYGFIAAMFHVSNPNSTGIPVYLWLMFGCFGLWLHALAVPRAAALDA